MPILDETTAPPREKQHGTPREGTRSLVVAGGRRWLFTTHASPEGAVIHVTDQDDAGPGIAISADESGAFLGALMGLIRR